MTDAIPGPWNGRSLIPLNAEDGHREVREAIRQHRDERRLPVMADGEGIEWCRTCGGRGGVATVPPGGAVCPACAGDGYTAGGPR